MLTDKRASEIPQFVVVLAIVVVLGAAAVWGSRMCRIGKEVNQQNQDDAPSACYACVMYFGPVGRRLVL